MKILLLINCVSLIIQFSPLHQKTDKQKQTNRQRYSELDCTCITKYMNILCQFKYVIRRNFFHSNKTYYLQS